MKLTNEQTQEIITLYQKGATLTETAKQTGIKKPTITALLKRNNIPTHRQQSTPEEIKQTVDLYRAGLSAKQIQEKLGLPSFQRVYYNLEKAGVDRTNKYEVQILSDGRPSLRSILSELTEDYVKNNMHVAAIARKYGYDHAAVYRCLQETGVLGLREARKTTVYDEYNNCFKHITPESLYWMGFLLADGGMVRDSTIALILAAKDEGHILKYSRFVNRPVKHGFNGYGHPNVRCTLHCREAMQDLVGWGLGGHSEDRFPTDLSWLDSVDFWRGVIDGDGCLTFDSSKKLPAPILNLVGSKQIVSEFKEFLNRNGVATTAAVRQKGKIYSFTIGTKKAVKAAHLLYDNPSFYLERKYLLAQKFKNLK